MTTPLVSIVIPTVNKSDLTTACFSSISRHTSNTYEIVWVDNGSNVKEFNRVKEFVVHSKLNVRCLKLDRNYGFIKATNLGIAESVGKAVVLLNNDTQVGYKWDTKLVKPVLEDMKIGAIGPVTQSKIAWQEASSLNRRWKLNIPVYHNSVDAYSKNLDKLFGEKFIDIGSIPLSFFCVAIRKTTFERIGLLDEDLGVGLGDDDEFCHRLRKNNFKNFLALGSFVFHNHRTTFKALNIDVDSTRRKNLAVLRSKGVIK